VGEKYFVRNLLSARKFPGFLGDERSGRGAIRFAWHALSFTWVMVSVVAISIADGVSMASLFGILAIVALVNALLALAWTRARHPAWIFLGASAVVFAAAAWLV
jgi:hypothetical protein